MFDGHGPVDIFRLDKGDYDFDLQTVLMAALCARPDLVISGWDGSCALPAKRRVLGSDDLAVAESGNIGGEQIHISLTLRGKEADTVQIHYTPPKDGGGRDKITILRKVRILRKNIPPIAANARRIVNPKGPAQKECADWLIAQYPKHPRRPKAEWRELAFAMWSERLSGEAFDRAWRTASRSVPDMKKAGRRKREDSDPNQSGEQESPP